MLTVPGRAAADHSRKVLVWLPPEYEQPQFTQLHFPVLMVLPGQPSTPEVMFRHYDFGQIAYHRRSTPGASNRSSRCSRH